MLIREEPATELTVATRILAHAGALAPDGRVALLTGEVVYIAGSGVSNHTMTPYDITIIRLRDGLELHGDPPADADRYLDALRTAAPACAAARSTAGILVSAASLPSLVRALLHSPWDDALAHASASGALIGAYPLNG